MKAKYLINSTSDLFSDQSKEQFISWWENLISSWGMSGIALIYLKTFFLILVAVVVSAVMWWVTRKVLIQIIQTIAIKSKTKWDDYLVKNKFFSALAHLGPILFLELMIDVVFSDFPRFSIFLNRSTNIVIIIICLYVFLRFLKTGRDVLCEKPRFKDKPIESYYQLTKIIVIGLFIVLMISVAFQVTPVVILTSMGALTAILLLIFKDTILGFVGSIQLATNDMIRIGDWITMEKYGADGDVVEINLASVKIQNFDKTITTIPTYSFISDSFKNWRGMLDSDGRRVMRSINIKIQSIKYCSAELLSKLGEIELIRSYIEMTEAKIVQYNKENKINKSVLLNGRNQTNIGIFRYYIGEYLLSIPEINQSMTLMVRQLDPTEKGVPIQLYAFTKTQDWAEYEVIMADIFDHLLAAVKYFELEVFEAPAGSDMRSLGRS